MPSYYDDREWSDQFLPQVKAVLANVLQARLVTSAITASFERDVKEATDVVLRAGELAVAVRMRRADYSGYRDEFTLRSSRPRGVPTELEKIRDGWGDYMFYGFGEVASGEPVITRWRVLDFDVMRQMWLLRPLILHRAERRNRDGSSGFIAHRYDWYPEDLIVAEDWVHPPESIYDQACSYCALEDLGLARFTDTVHARVWGHNQGCERGGLA